MKNYNWALKLNTTQWTQEVMAQTSVGTAHAGATLTVFKIYPDRFECFWIGDSSGKVYCGEETIFETNDHNYNHKDYKHMPYTDGNDIKIINKHTAVQVNAKRFTIGGENTNMTRCLGHRGLFCQVRNFDHAVIPRTEKQYKIVAGSDGFWQMTCDEDTPLIADIVETSERLAKFANRRWRQPWRLQTDEIIHHELHFPEDNIDDICVAARVVYPVPIKAPEAPEAPEASGLLKQHTLVSGDL